MCMSYEYGTTRTVHNKISKLGFCAVLVHFVNGPSCFNKRTELST